MSDYKRVSSFNDAVSDLDPGSTWDVDPTDPNATKFDPGYLEIHSIIHGGDCDVTLLEDGDRDGTSEVSNLLDSFTGEGIMMGNEIQLHGGHGMILRIENTGTEPADYAVTGEERLP